jgi:hypothetical protein
VRIVNKVSYPLLSDSLQSKGGGFFNPPRTLALMIDPGNMKLQAMKFNPTNPTVEKQTIKISLVKLNFIFLLDDVSRFLTRVNIA